MPSALGIGTVVVTGLATAGLAFLVAPELGDAVTSDAPTRETEPSPTAPGAVDAAQEFWDLALDRRCVAASRLMWWPADREARQRAYAGICADADLPTRVTIGEARRVGSTQTPYGASDYVIVPVFLAVEGPTGTEHVDDELRMVEVDDRWLVTR